MQSVHRLYLSKLVQSLIRCSDIIKLLVAKTKRGWIKQDPVAK